MGSVSVRVQGKQTGAGTTAIKSLEDRRSDWVGITMMRHMFTAGSCFKLDLCNLGKMYANAGNVSSAYRELTASGMLKETKRLGRATVDITPKGERNLAAIDPWFKENAEMCASPGRARSEKTFQRIYGRSRPLLAMAAAGAAVLPYEKPSLASLWAAMAGMPEPEPRKGYAHPGREEMKNLLERGVYYTIKEVSDAITDMLPGSPDQYLGTRCRGIFLSQNETFAVYCGTAGKDRMARWHPVFETEFKRILSRIAGDTTGTFRKLDIPGRTAYNSIGAIFITEGFSRISDMLAPGMKNQKQLEKAESSGPPGLMNWQQEVYDRLWVVPATPAGMAQLEWLISHSFEERTAEADALFSEIPGFSPIPVTPAQAASAGGDGWQLRWMRVMDGVQFAHIPVAEITLLHHLLSDSTLAAAGAACSPEIARAAAAASAKPFKAIDENGTEIRVASAAEKREKKKESRKFRRQRMHRTTLELTTGEGEALAKAASEAGMSVNRYVRKWAAALIQEAAGE